MDAALARIVTHSKLSGLFRVALGAYSYILGKPCIHTYTYMHDGTTPELVSAVFLTAVLPRAIDHVQERKV
jgi:hypothetical protein